MSDFIHAIVSGSYSSYRVVAVCEDAKTAKAWCDAIRTQSNGYGSDASIERMAFIPKGAIPRKQRWVMLTEDWLNSGASEHFNVQDEVEYAIASYHGEAPERPKARFVRAPIHRGLGGRIEINGRSRQAVMKVYSEQKAMWKASPQTFNVPA